MLALCDLVLAVVFMFILPAAFVVTFVECSQLVPLLPISVVCAAAGCALTAQQLLRLQRLKTNATVLWAALIMMIVPVYSLMAWMTMFLNDFANWFEVFKTLYESFTLFCFLMLFRKRSTVLDVGEADAITPSLFWALLQYIMLNVASAFLIFMTPSEHMEWLFHGINFLSCSIALAAVVSLHRTSPLTPSNTCKFWCIKGMVTMLFAQHLMFIAIPEKWRGSRDPSVAELERALICLEMLPLAIAYRWAYPTEEFASSATKGDEPEAPGLVADEEAAGAAPAPCVATPFLSSGQATADRRRSLVSGMTDPLDAAYGVGFFGVFSGLVLTMYSVVLVNTRKQVMTAVQSDECHWYNWFRYVSYCSPTYYNIDTWLDQSHSLAEWMQSCLLLFFVALFVLSIFYLLFKSDPFRPRPSIVTGILAIAPYVLCVLLFLSILPMVGAAVNSVLRPKA